MSSQSQSGNHTQFTLLDNLMNYNLPQRLRKNHYPVHNVEKSQLSNLLASADAELRQYDVEIARLQARITSFTKQKAVLKEHLSYAQSLLSPIRRLSHDVLIDVFSHLISASSGMKILLGEPKKSVAFLNASHVCAYWRNVTHSTPSLWRNLDISGRLGRTFPSDVEWILQKSRAVPLSIAMSIHEQNSAELAPLLESADRWESLRLNLCSRDQTQLLQAMQHKLPRLKTLEVMLTQATYGAAPITLDFGNVPSLTNLTLHLPHGLHVEQFNGPIDLRVQPLGGLSRLNLRLHSLPQFQALISQCRKLKYLKLEIYHKSDLAANSHRSTLRRLETLVLGLGRGDSALYTLRRLFTFLTLPCLTSMTIFVESSVLPWPISRFDSMRQRSELRLLNLTIVARNSSISDLVEMLRRLPSLVSLELIDVQRDVEPTSFLVSMNLMMDLCVHDKSFVFSDDGAVGQDVLLPCLRSLSFIVNGRVFIGKYQHLLSSMLQMIHSRWRWNTLTNAPEPPANVTLLERIRFNTDGVLAEELVAPFRDLQLAGLDIEIGSESRAWDEWAD